MKNDYSMFSKEELVKFLEQYEDKFKCWQNPFYILCRDKVNNIMQKINENIKRYGEIITRICNHNHLSFLLLINVCISIFLCTY